ncbi:molecular chaperone Hsp70 [Lentzea aerocolonigenes]|uniref:Molecular chaperone Hsp70 n=1 Tax=Lentzea aerocolonigenes TaxID=68170 RepID=A0A0F0HEE8_LENAE|nr:Hsp70 family protein [Lentzea aerocolonigenes]KJK53246.1 molecular chaperone Hsp70 [Lentzea aerocolonigenes]
MRVLSVDLGTANTVAVLSDHGVVDVDGGPTMPSSVYLDEDGTLRVGREAERRSRQDPSRYEANPKRHIDKATIKLGETNLPINDAIAAIYARVMEAVTPLLQGGQLDEIRLTHPAEWGPTRRTKLLSSARLAGMTGELVPVPEAIAVASLGGGRPLAVYDFGADTFDVSVLDSQHRILADGSLGDVGGLDIDQALLEHIGRSISHKDPAGWQRLLRPVTVDDHRARLGLREELRLAKEDLSELPQVEVMMPEPFEKVVVTRGELEALIRPSLIRTTELLITTVHKAGVTPEHVYLVGGSCRMPLVAQVIAEKVGIVPTNPDHPETIVASGAQVVDRAMITLKPEDDKPRYVEPPTVVTAPVSPAVSGPHQVNPNVSGPNPVISGSYPNPNVSGPYSASGTYQLTSQYPMNPNVSGSYPMNFPQQQMPPKKDNKKVLLGIGGAVVVLALVIGAVFAFNRPDLPSADECKDDVTQDGQGFTKCLRQLAGHVPDGGGCEKADSAQITGMEEIKGTVVSCTIRDGYAVQYILTDSVTGAENNAEAIAKSFQTDRVEADWTGNGLEGSYRAATSSGTGVLVFTAKGRPMFGILTKNAEENADELKPDEIADFFEQTVQPGE